VHASAKNLLNNKTSGASSLSKGANPVCQIRLAWSPLKKSGANDARKIHSAHFSMRAELAGELDKDRLL
jgi:hypothetical protein